MNSFRKIQSREINEIADKKVVNGRIRYLVKWRRFSELNTWEPAERLSSSDIQRFEEKNTLNSITRLHAERAQRETRTSNSFVSKIPAKKKEPEKIASSDSDRREEAKDVRKCFIDLIKTQFQCSICLEVYKEACVTNCGHFFCTKCLEKWKQNHSITCPICRGSLLCTNQAPDVNNFLSQANALLNDVKK